MNKVFTLFFLFVIAPTFTAFLSAEENWEKELTKDGITVYTRPAEGSPLKEFKGETLIDAPMEVCRNVLDDIESHVNWRPNCIASRLISRNGNIIISYTETKAPWPVLNRDVIIKSTMNLSEDKITIEFTAVNDPGLVPLKKGVIRLTELSGTWILLRKNESTFVTYQAKINPAGTIPVWLANQSNIDQPSMTLLGLREMSKNPKYQAK